ncbi:hypothetical protein MRB53_042222 [Persea americana]|nr:hypothetical protein MRB53_042210 [Persea americana]KAJ8603255.1 hypothetical protein MRB53_042216 [Persea americana]KAJ8603261.1 hypothetical protein MRB53_042222 [Persea americana]
MSAVFRRASARSTRRRQASIVWGRRIRRGECGSLGSVIAPRDAARPGRVGQLRRSAGDTVKLREVPKAPTTAAGPKGRVQHQGNDLGDGNNVGDATMGDPQPSATGLAAYACSSTTRW